MTRGLEHRAPGSIRHRAPRGLPAIGRAGRGLSTSGEVALSNESMTALVTGAGSGIGRAIGGRAGRSSASGSPWSAATPAKLEATREPRSAADDTLVEPCDVADRAGVDAMAGRVLAAFGGDRRPGLQRRDERPRPEPREALARPTGTG